MEFKEKVSSQPRDNSKETANNGNLGEGSVKKLVFRLALPAVMAQVINLLYNIVDRIYIGHIPEIGAAALTGVGLFAPILTLINAFAMLIGGGGSPLAAIAMGKKNNEKAEQIIGNSFTMLLIFSIVLTAAFYIAMPQLLIWFGASKATLGYGLEYGRIYVLGAICVLMVMGMNPFISTQGFAKISMLTTIIGAVTNIILDPIMIFVLKLGVRGAAIATVLSQAISAVWILRFLCGKKTILKLRKENLPLRSKVILPCLGLGVSVFVMLSTESILSMSYISRLSKYGGDVAVGAMTIITSTSMLLNMPLHGMTHGGQPVISYNFGARKNERVKEAFFTVFATCVGYSVLFWAMMIFLPKVVARIFTTDPELIAYTSWSLRIYMACIFTCGFQNSCQQSFMALGQAKVSLLLACLRKLVLLIPLIFILPNFFDNKVFAVFLAEPVSDTIAATVTTIIFMTRFGKILKQGPIQRNI